MVRQVAGDTYCYDPLNLCAPLPKDVPNGVANFVPELHFVLNTQRGGLVDADGRPATIPDKLNGLSGAPVWQTWWPSKDFPDVWRSRQARVVGIQTSYYSKKSLVKATDWAAAVYFIWEQHPELRPVLDMHFGPPDGPLAKLNVRRSGV
jgi:hypothetical protein